tara:strand:- start:5657 stop:5833 length:177 start_codon:yes stop_codon:yes gene_type:complete
MSHVPEIPDVTVRPKLFPESVELRPTPGEFGFMWIKLGSDHFVVIRDAPNDIITPLAC